MFLSSLEAARHFPIGDAAVVFFLLPFGSAGIVIDDLVPEGCAHGYLTLVDDTKITYKTTHVYMRDASVGVHHADPAIGIEWPIAVDMVSAQDAGWPPLGG